MAFPLTSGGAQHFATRKLGVTTLGLTVGTEDTNVIDIDVQLQDVAGNSVASADAWVCTVVGEAAAVATVAETGAGAELGTTAKPGLGFTLSAAGAAQLAITDVVGASGLTFCIHFQPLDGLSVPIYTEVTFD